MAAQRWLIVNADEFGRSENINRGVARAHRQGIVTSASLMVRSPAAEHAAAIGRDLSGLSVGLHLDLGEWAYRAGEWRRVYAVVDLDDREAVAAEVQHQLTRFRELTGGLPTHLDSYQHLHREGHLRSVLRELADRLAVPVRGVSARIRHIGGFFGQTSQGEPYPDGITPAALVAILKGLPAGCSELACHPGEVEELELGYRMERFRELGTLCDPRVREVLSMSGIRLRSFHGLLADLERAGLHGETISRAHNGLDPAPRTGSVAGGGEGASAPTSPPRLLIRSGYRLRREGHLTAALEAFERAVELAPRSDGIQRGHRVVAGEVRVLRDGWTLESRDRESIAPIRGRVLHLVGRSLPYVQTGYAIRTGYVVRAQRAVGLDPQVVTQLDFPPVGDDATPFTEVVDGVRHHRLPSRGPLPVELDVRLSANVALLTDLVRRTRPAVLHAASDYRNGLMALSLGRRFRLPVVYEMRGFWEETRLVKQGAGAAQRESYRWHRAREIQCARDADRVVTLSEGMKAHLVEQGIAPDRIHVIPNAVDPGAFSDAPRDGALARSLGVEPDEAVVGYISGLAAYEGIHILLESIARLVSRGHRVRGLIVGDGDERDSLEALAGHLGITDRVVFTGRVPHADVLRYYGLIDVFVVPRTADRVCQLVTPLKPYEAMAAGRALVVSGVGALREMVEDGVTGVVFPPEDPDALASILESLIHDGARRAELGAAAREWVCRNRTWRQSGELYLELYRSLGGVLPVARETRLPSTASTFCETRLP